jgi:NAD(P)-dependent dehydrogenase (short-subunit alcohol dehydrogenase family)
MLKYLKKYWYFCLLAPLFMFGEIAMDLWQPDMMSEIVDKGVLINAVSPGSVSPAENDDINFSKYSDLCYIGRTGTDRENADLICFLASEENGYISGENIVIDGTRKKL